MFKSKLLNERMAEIEKMQEKKMQEWWGKILPRKGSLLRQLVDKELI